MIKLDYTIESPEERNKLVQKILDEAEEPLSEKYLEILADYLVLCMEKQERKQKKILTDNRMVTVNKRETSFEGLVSQLENGEDGIYNLISDSKAIIFQPKVSITKKDLEEIPFLKQIREAIQIWEEKLKTATGRDAFIIKKAIIDLRKDQYVVKDAFRKPVRSVPTFQSKYYHEFPDLTNEFDADGYPIPKGATLIDPKICSFILCNYSKLKESSWDQLPGDLWHFMQDFDDVSERALADYPIYRRIVEYKIDGRQNIDIQKALEQEFGETHSLEYISSLWRNKIPKLIASTAEDDWLYHYYLNEAPGKYKRCSRCGQIKLAHNKYFSKNKTSKDGFYSICKSCRNSKKK